MAEFYQLPHTGTFSGNGGNSAQLTRINNNNPNDWYETDATGTLNLDLDFGTTLGFKDIFMEVRNVHSYRLIADPGASQTVLATVTTPPITIHTGEASGDQYGEQYSLDTVNFDANILRLEVSRRITPSAPIGVNRIWAMQPILDLATNTMRGMTEETMGFQQRTSKIRTDAIYGTRARTNLLLRQLKRSVRYRFLQLGNNILPVITNILNLYRNNPNFVFSQEFARYPDRVYIAHFANDNLVETYFSRVKTSGQFFEFTIEEN